MKRKKKTRRRKTYKVGENISFKLGQRRVSGTVVAKRKEFYWVKRGNRIYKVDRKSIFTALGYGLGKVVSGVVSFGEAGYKSYKAQREKEKADIRRRLRKQRGY